MTPASPNSFRFTRIWIFLLIALALLSFFAMRRSLAEATRMKSEITASVSPAQLKPGEEIKVVLEITAVSPAASIEGSVLEKQSESIYRRTASKLNMTFDSSTPVLMGKAPDLHPGAVVHITAKMADDRILHAQQIVVLTGYVKVTDQ
jgi:hypothetical protein